MAGPCDRGSNGGSWRTRRWSPLAICPPTIPRTRWQGVVVNVRAEGGAERLLGVSKHVCEVQIVLETFQRILEVGRGWVG